MWFGLTPRTFEKSVELGRPVKNQVKSTTFRNFSLDERRGGRTESAGRIATATRPEPGVATSPTHTYSWTWSPPWFLPLFCNAKSVNDQCRSTSHSQTILHETRPTAEYVLNTLDACAQAQEYRIHTHPKKDQQRR